MANRIKGITVEIGGDTTGLSKALSGVNKDLRSTQSQLKDVERLLKLDPGNVELLAQKQRLLSGAIEDTEKKLDSLREAEKQVQAQFERGEISEAAYNGLQREIASTEISLRDLKEQARQTERAIDGIDEDPVEDVEKAAKNAGEALNDAEKDASSFGDVLKAGALIEGVKSIGGAISDLSDETKEYQKIMGSLEVSSEKAGYSADETAQTYRQLYGVLGDDQTAATTTANLQALGLAQSDLTKMTDIAIGAWATYGDSIPIDSLSEAINETAKTGTVTGTLADALNWAGVSEDEFNERLATTSDQSERANMILEQLTSQGLAEAGQAWRDNNKDLVAANEAQADFTETAAQMSEELAPVTGAVREGFNDIFESILQLLEGVDFEAIAEGISGAFGFFTTTVIPIVTQFLQFLIENGDIIAGVLLAIAGGLAAMKLAEFATNLMSVITGVATLSQTFPLLGSAISMLTNPMFLVGAALTALVLLFVTKGDEIKQVLQDVDDFLQVIFATDFSETFGWLGGILNGFLDIAEGVWGAFKGTLEGIIDFVQGVFSGDWSQAWNGIVNIFTSIFGGLGELAKGILNVAVGAINGLISGINWVIDRINSISVDLPFGMGHIGFDIPRLSQIAYLAKGGILTQGNAIVGENGPELLTMSPRGAVVQPLTNGTTNNAWGGITVNVYGAPGQDVNELADLVADRVEAAVQRQKAVWE